MISRAALLVVLVVIEAAIIGMGVLAVRGDSFGGTWTAGAASQTPADALVEGGAARTFAAGAAPSVSVDIGYADLTIRTGQPGHIDVSVSKSSAFGPLRAKAPITAHGDAGTVRVSTETEHWSIGDNRMVTIVVPPATRVNVDGAGDITASGLRAAASLSSSGNGKIAIDDFDAPTLHVETSNGRIRLMRVAASRVEVSSSDGRIEASALRVRDGTIESSNGRVTLGIAPGSDTLLTAEASNGRVRFSGFGSTSADSGDARNNGDDQTRTLRIGAGSGRLDVSASDGDIRIDQES